ncbi:hypothetical protein BDV98DRAFT_593419 [Pterulicium gracile]|uniref:C2H2-type domain-containing protein n=1 Tax=Pterulicium gracile TaxID=1884261 RepID=A0A5C3QG66_9AGAR|nr:hypothetical protein BDV98DRAFT_593419 [Pterula gracilis]
MEYPYFGTPLELPGAVYSYDPSIQVQPLRHERKGRKHGLSDRKMQALQEMKDRHKRENQLYRQDMGIDPRLTQTPVEYCHQDTEDFEMGDDSMLNNDIDSAQAPLFERVGDGWKCLHKHCKVRRPFTEKGSVERHWKTLHAHTKERFECPSCHNDFSRQDAVNKHVKGGSCPGSPSPTKKGKTVTAKDSNAKRHVVKERSVQSASGPISIKKIGRQTMNSLATAAALKTSKPNATAGPCSDRTLRRRKSSLSFQI